MTAGLPESLALTARLIGAVPGEPLTLEMAADVLHIRRKNARWIATQPIFQGAFNTAAGLIRARADVRPVRKDGRDDRGPDKAGASGRSCDLRARFVAGIAIDLTQQSFEERNANALIKTIDACAKDAQ